MANFLAYLAELRSPPVEVPLEPKLDDQKGPDEEDDGAKDSEVRGLETGAIMKALLHAGEGEDYPARGDQVWVHWTVRAGDDPDRILKSSALEHGGDGVPDSFLVGKGCRALRGWELAVQQMQRGERSLFKIKPEMAYAHPSAQGMTPPPGAGRGDTLGYELELLDFGKAAAATGASEDHGVLKRTLAGGEGWETPRAPFEVTFACTARRWGGAGGAARPVQFFHAPESDPITATVGSGDIPGGLEEGICNMTPGERAVITVCDPGRVKAGRCVPGLSTGEAGVEFEVALIAMVHVRDMTGDGGVIKRKVRDGEGEFPIDCPLEDCLVRVHYVARVVGGRTVKETRRGAPEEFLTGTDSVPRALDMAVRLMLVGEVSVVRARSDFAFDSHPASRPDGCPEGADIEWELELVGFDKRNDWRGMTFKEQMDDSLREKELANGLFRSGKFALAKDKYRRACHHVEQVYREGLVGEDLEGLSTLRVQLILNTAGCDLKLENWADCIKACGKVLDAEPDNAKAVYRRGMAQMGRGGLDEAEEDFRSLSKIPGSEADGKAALAKITRARDDIRREERRQYKDMFAKKMEVEREKKEAKERAGGR